MGREVHFYVGLREVGCIHFSGLTTLRQTHAYGMDYLDCLTYDEGGEEMVGSPELDDGSGFYAPDWDRAVRRSERLLKAVQATDCPHRREYDTDRVSELVRLVAWCASPNRRPYARVRLT